MQHVRVASEVPAGLRHAHGTGLIVSVGKTDMHPKLTEMLQHAEDPTDRKALQQALGVLDDIFIGGSHRSNFLPLLLGAELAPRDLAIFTQLDRWIDRGVS
jgi:hypothetical protein